MKTSKNAKRKYTALKVWGIIFSVLFVVALVCTIVLNTNTFLYNTVSMTALGGKERYLKSGDPSQYIYYEADYDSKEQVLAAANALNERIVEEGIILLKNDENALPLESGKKITVLGKNSVYPVFGGSGSNSGTTDQDVTGVYESLEAAGFICNPVAKAFYENDALSGDRRPSSPPVMGSILTGYPTCETSSSSYTDEVKNSFEEYSDAAVVFLSRVGGEGWDLPRTMFWNGRSYTDTKWSGTEPVPGAESVDSHYLELDLNERALLQMANDNFENVIVVFNSPSAMELGFLKDDAYPNVNAALWLGAPGNSGMSALGRVLNGTVNPSGRTVDTFARDFTKDPTWFNFGNNRQLNGNRYLRSGGESSGAYFVEYREGIYVGYRYYETKAFTAGGDWWDENVVYPFGYGLSYTDFEYTAAPSPENTAVLTADGKLTFTVEVSNTGGYDGKEVIQLYYSAPYTEGGIEKSHVVLGDFAKTDVLAAGGAPQTVTLSIDVRDMASYDYNDANGFSGTGYELEEGTYTIYITDNAHGWADENVIKFTYTVPEGGFTYDTDSATGNPVTNLFDDVSAGIAEDNYLSRADDFANFNKLQGASDASYRVMDEGFFDSLTYRLDDSEDDPWYSSQTPTQSARELTAEEVEVKLYELIGKEYGDGLWDELLNQLTVDQMVELISTGNFRTIDIESIDKPLTIDADGPMGFAIFTGGKEVYDTCYYASECVLGATFNKDLAYEMGKMVGNEGLIGYENEGGSGWGRPYSGWYAPAMNIHRSPFGGRNFEYYSEDGLLSGVMAQSVAAGANDKGLYTFAKHFALNDQETCRDENGLVTWANEQSMREIYFKPFEMSVKNAGITAMMSSFNRLGITWTGGSYALLTQLLRDEWGFEGTVITDFSVKGYLNADQMIRAGGDLSLNAAKSPSSVTTSTDITNIRRAAKNVLYTVANSCAMNGLGEGVVWGYTLPAWVTWLIIITVVFFVGTAVFWIIYIIKLKNNKSKNGGLKNEI